MRGPGEVLAIVVGRHDLRQSTTPVKPERGRVRLDRGQFIGVAFLIMHRAEAASSPNEGNMKAALATAFLVIVGCGSSLSEKERVALVAAAQAIRRGAPPSISAPPEHVVVLRDLGHKVGHPDFLDILDMQAGIIAYDVQIDASNAEIARLEGKPSRLGAFGSHEDDLKFAELLEQGRPAEALKYLEHLGR